MATKRPIEEMWQSYKTKLLDPVGAGPVQINETRRAFFAGAIGVFFEIVSNVSKDDEITDEDLALFDRIKEEADDYIESIQLEASI